MTEHQKEKLLEILRKPDKVVGFWGEGGTGKSTTISRFLKSLPKGKSVQLCTTTHQSLSVLTDMIPDECECTISTATIHSYLGYRVSNEQGNAKLIKTKKEPTACDFLIVDESSYLTVELLKALHSSSLESTVKEKIILVGDKMQLTIDDFLNLDSVPSVELTENMRQTKGSSLHKYCRELRCLIEETKEPIPIPQTDDMCVMYDHKEFIDAYKNCSSNKTIVAFLNSTVKTYNSNIKNKMLKADTYSVGDTVIVMDPVFKITSGEKNSLFHNRERVIIDRVVKDTDDDWNKLACIDSSTDKSFVEELKKNITILICSHNGKVGSVRVPKTKKWINDNLNHFKNRALKGGSWKPFYDFKERYNFVHHSYAVTVYSAQGSTFDEVFIDLSDFNPPNDPSKNKLLRMVYVAMTRARVKATCFLGTERHYEQFGKE